MSAPDHEPHRSRRFLLLLKGRPHMDLISGLPSGPAACEPHQRPHTCQHPTTSHTALEDFSCSSRGVHTCRKAGCPDPVSRPSRHPSPLTLPLLDSLAVVTAPTPPQPELDKRHPWPAVPRRCGPSCWPAPPAPASVACGRACAPAMSQLERPCARPSVPPRWPQ